MSDIDIARKAKKIHIRDVASKINIPEENLIPYGHDIAKIDFDFIEKNMSNPDGKLILVTAISPTPAGEGKTTTSVGLTCLLYTSPSPRDRQKSRMPSSA